MAHSVNKVILIGNLARDASLRYTQANRPVLNFCLVTNKSWQNKSTGEWEESAEFHNCAMFGDFAERISPRLVKGSKVYVEGEIQTKRWTGKDGTEKEAKDIHAHQVISLSKQERRDTDGGYGFDDDPPQPENNDGPEADDDMPF